LVAASPASPLLKQQPNSNSVVLVERRPWLGSALLRTVGGEASPGSDHGLIDRTRAHAPITR
jgi:hypothetical protein